MPEEVVGAISSPISDKCTLCGLWVAWVLCTMSLHLGAGGILALSGWHTVGGERGSELAPS